MTVAHYRGLHERAGECANLENSWRGDASQRSGNAEKWREFKFDTDQFDPEFAHADGAFHAYGAAHQFDQLPGDHQADAIRLAGIACKGGTVSCF